MKLHNTLTGKVEPFIPLQEGEVRMYNCGPTVYKRQHLGNFRAFITADLLRRTLTYLGYRVTQIMNITDVGHLTEDDVADASGEDKLQKIAKERKLDPWEIAREQEQFFKDDLAALHIPPADEYPRATDHIPEMIAMIETLIEKGHAYEADGNVYFSVESFPGYGKLSGNTPDKLEAGAGGRVVADRDDKRSPHDFALWKRDPKHLMQWDSPWGKGFPGWHIECSAMSHKYLGETLDIHTGGPDNIFPHHECEIAQSESIFNKTFTRYWVHCGWLEIGGGKMSKSKGEMYTLPELFEMGYDGRDLRMFLTRQSYGGPLPFDLDLLDQAKAERGRFQNFVSYEMRERPEGPDNPAVGAAIDAARAAFRAALEDNINTAGAMAALHTFTTEINRIGPNRSEAENVIAFMRECDAVFGILDPDGARSLDEEIEQLIAERQAARDKKNWARSDEIRDELLARGIELLDTAQGVRWKKT